MQAAGRGTRQRLVAYVEVEVTAEGVGGLQGGRRESVALRCGVCVCVGGGGTGGGRTQTAQPETRGWAAPHLQHHLVAGRQAAQQLHQDVVAVHAAAVEAAGGGAVVVGAAGVLQGRHRGVFGGGWGGVGGGGHRKRCVCVWGGGGQEMVVVKGHRKWLLLHDAVPSAHPPGLEQELQAGTTGLGRPSLLPDNTTHRPFH